MCGLVFHSMINLPGPLRDSARTSSVSLFSVIHRRAARFFNNWLRSAALVVMHQQANEHSTMCSRMGNFASRVCDLVVHFYFASYRHAAELFRNVQCCTLLRPITAYRSKLPPRQGCNSSTNGTGVLYEYSTTHRRDAHIFSTVTSSARYQCNGTISATYGHSARKGN